MTLTATREAWTHPTDQTQLWSSRWYRIASIRNHKASHPRFNPQNLRQSHILSMERGCSYLFTDTLTRWWLLTNPTKTYLKMGNATLNAAKAQGIALRAGITFEWRSRGGSHHHRRCRLWSVFFLSYTWMCGAVQWESKVSEKMVINKN